MKRLRISYGRTIQPIKFESIRIDVSIEKDVPDDESLLDAANKTIDSLKPYVKSKLHECMVYEGYIKE